MEIVDAHVHVFSDQVVCRPRDCFESEPCFELLYGRPSAALVSVEDLLSAMDTDGVQTAVACGFAWRDPGRAREHNQLIVQAAGAHPGRLVPLAAVDPLGPGALAEAERALAAGAAGLGEIGAYLDDLGDEQVMRSLTALARLCAEADRPMLLHTNEPVGHDYPGKAPMGLKGLYDLVRACPETRFQLAHLGGGIFFYELLRRDATAALAGCVFDTAAVPFLYRPEVIPIFCQLAGEQRLLYGSDYPLVRLSRYLKDFDAAGLAPDLRQKILADNARAFWRL